MIFTRLKIGDGFAINELGLLVGVDHGQRGSQARVVGVGDGLECTQRLGHATWQGNQVMLYRKIERFCVY